MDESDRFVQTTLPTSPTVRSAVSWKERFSNADVADILEFMVCAVAAAYLIAYVAIALNRITYPFDLEWMEGATVDHVNRILVGQRIYVRPSLDFVPFLYPPLYYYISAAVSRVTGIGWFPLRFVSLISSGVCFWLIYRLVKRETGSWYAGLVAVGTFAATYRLGGAWLDIARVDSLFLALLLAALYVARFAESRRSWALAGALLALSALTKQTALMIAVPLLLYAAAVDWRGAIALALGFGGLFAAATAGLYARHGGWYIYYVFGLPVRIQEVGGIRANFWRKDILAGMPVAAAVTFGYLASRRALRSRPTLFYAALTVALLGSSWASRLHVGAYDNVLIPAYAALAILFALGLHDLSQHASLAGTGSMRTFIAAMCLVQLAALAYNPRAQMPTKHDLELERRLVRSVRNTEERGVHRLSWGTFRHWAVRRRTRTRGRLSISFALAAIPRRSDDCATKSAPRSSSGDFGSSSWIERMTGCSQMWIAGIGRLALLSNLKGSGP